MFPPVNENRLEGSIPRPANEGPTTCERPEAAGALEAGVREIEIACAAIVKHEAESSSELIAMVYGMQDVECLTNKRRLCKGKQEATESNHCSIKLDIEKYAATVVYKSARPALPQSRSGYRTDSALILVTSMGLLTSLSASRLPHLNCAKTLMLSGVKTVNSPC